MNIDNINYINIKRVIIFIFINIINKYYEQNLLII
jgi:hypothetical protein